MATAPLLKIIYTGLQDERLLPPKGKPSLAFFKKVFIKAGRFTTSWVRLDFDTKPAFGTSATITLPRQGHLITRLYLVATMPDISAPCKLAKATAGSAFVGPTFGWTNSLGHALINTATIDIGGARVEQISGQLMEMMDEFQTPLEKVTVVNRMLPRLDNGFNSTSIGWGSQPTTSITPLPFWFSRGDPGIALPIDAIGVDSVKMTIAFNPLNSLYVSSAQVDISGLVQGQIPGSAYFPLLNSPFYQSTNPTKTVYGLTGDPSRGTEVSPIPNSVNPSSFLIGDTYIMAEYIYLDNPEANAFRISDISYPIVQHYAITPYDTLKQPRASIPMRIPNPTRDIFFYAQRYEAPLYNASFLATRDLYGLDVTISPWWPDAQGLNPVFQSEELIPAFSTRESEPLQSINLIYEGSLTRYVSHSPSVFRSYIPSFNQKKSPWVNRYYYNLSFGVLTGLTPPSIPTGEANLDKVQNIELHLEFKPMRGSIDPNNIPRYRIFIYAETYNILRIYGGRAGLLFSY